MKLHSTNSFICGLKPYIQPFERELALREMAALARTAPQAISNRPNEFKVATTTDPDSLAHRLAYWEFVLAEDRHRRYTRQSKKEASFAVAQNGVSLQEMQAEFLRDTDYAVKLPRRRCLRYGPHGLHEYRGKFFPQLVLSLLNIAGVLPNDLVADPMCGSGTTLVEGSLTGAKCLGLDMNPLSVFMSETKASVLKERPEDVIDCFFALKDQLADSSVNHGNLASQSLDRLSDSDLIYLKRWFDARILLKLASIHAHIEDLHCPTAIKRLFLLSLSNILRRLSWQKNDDLRVRREYWDPTDIDVVTTFLNETERSVRLCASCSAAITNNKLGAIKVVQGDAREWSRHWHQLAGTVDVVVTSPPYATALPYLDTDRLSLVFLGLLQKTHHRKHDLTMIGNREITKAIRDNYWFEFTNSQDELPQSVYQLVSKIHSLNEKSTVGCRRRNVSALLAKYFLDMKQVFTETHTMLKPNAPAFFVVGDNHTVAGGQRVEINTTKLLADIAESVGFIVESSMNMDMLISRDIFRENASKTEMVLSLRKP